MNDGMCVCVLSIVINKYFTIALVLAWFPIQRQEWQLFNIAGVAADEDGC